MKLEDGIDLCNSLIREHAVLSDWSAYIDSSKSRAGLCSFNRRMIYLSKHFVENNPEHIVRNTILHEIAHALVGWVHHHDDVWRAKAIELGCDGNRCYDPRMVKMPEKRYELRCLHCGRIARRHRLPKGQQASCGHCSPWWDPRFLMEIRDLKKA